MPFFGREAKYIGEYDFFILPNYWLIALFGVRAVALRRWGIARNTE